MHTIIREVVIIRRLKTYTVIGILFSLIAGSISHFVYEWTGDNLLAGLFFPVNESVWEHMKLIFFPMLLYSFVMEKQLCSEFPCIISSLAGGILSGTLAVPIIFYTYTGILGYDVPVMDILTFAISIVIGFLVIYKSALSCKLKKYQVPLLILTGVFLACFILFSVTPPAIGLFRAKTPQTTLLRYL